MLGLSRAQRQPAEEVAEQGPVEKKAVSKPKPSIAAKAIGAVQDGTSEVAGRTAAKDVADQRGALGGTAGFAGANNVLTLQMQAKSGAGVRPQRDDFPSEEAFDKAYLSYQSAQMAKLGAEFPDATIFGQVFHGTDLPPGKVLKDGIPMKGEGNCFDLAKHQREFGGVDTPPDEQSAMRGSCLDARMPAKFAGEGGFVYVLKPVGGSVSLDGALGDKQATGAQGELEYSFGARQPPSQILGYFEVGRYSDVHDAFRLGKMIKNPGADPQ